MKGAFIMKNTLATLAIVFAIASMSLTAAAQDKIAPPPPPAGPVNQIVLLLDTSNSMDGLIDQAKTQLWKIVNEFIPMKINGKRPELRIALYEYGNSGLSHATGYIRQVLPFTDDLDRVSKELFALTTNGGDEYCGQVIQSALNDLQWSSGPNDLKTIFIAGNEPFSQGTVDYHSSCRGAISRGITVNTIFCGAYDEGVQTSWKDGAVLADGAYMNIDQSVQVAHIDAPQDAEIVRLGEELNRTYIPFGEKGKKGAINQEAQDQNALAAAPGAMLERSVAKSSAYYKSSDWDLVDAVESNEVELKNVQEEQLPENLQKMTVAEREKYLQDTMKERDRIQSEIRKLNDERNAYVAEKRKEMAVQGEDTLDSAMIKALREQAVRKGYVFE